MDPDIKKKWVAALRSGEYRQGTGKLQTLGGTNCCLGVLLRVQGQDVIELYRDEDGTFSFLNVEVSHVPLDFAAGLTLAQQGRLAKMNDGDRLEDVPPHSFEQIADYIEKNL